jgi:mannose-6-phosphate isomerase-like protein (cupin superfamily)
MRRREFLAVSAGVSGALVAETFALTPSLGAQTATKIATKRAPVLMREGMSRFPDGTVGPKTFQHALVRSFDSEGRLVVMTLPVGTYEHFVYQGAPLHLHHDNDEWLYILEGEFVAEVGGARYRLKRGDSLLLPMRIPHRWSVAGEAHVGSIHLYTPGGTMDTFFDPGPANAPQPTAEEMKAEFERHGCTLLGAPLTKEEIDAV